jgi:hypothetical protein
MFPNPFVKCPERNISDAVLIVIALALPFIHHLI